MPTNDYLAHYGVLGMKWGVRKDRSSSGKKRNKSKVRTRIEKEIKTRKARDKRVKSMSDVELRREINRLNMEKQYKELTQTDLEKGVSYVMSMINSAYRDTTTNAIKRRFNKVYGIKGGKK